MNFATLKVEDRGLISIVSIHRPEKLNALSKKVLTELRELLTSLQNMREVKRGLIITGAGEKAFISGADIKEMSLMSFEEGESFGRLGQEVSLLIEGFPAPVIACVNGLALGGGCEIAMSCDFIYATEAASFGQPEVKLGLIPGFGGCVRLFRKVGPGAGKELIYTGRRIAAREALQLNLVNKMFSSNAEMMKAAELTLLEIAKNSPLAVSVCKQVLNKADGENVQNGLESELAGFRRVFESPEMREGTSAFLEKRTPDFS